MPAGRQGPEGARRFGELLKGRQDDVLDPGRLRLKCDPRFAWVSRGGGWKEWGRGLGWGLEDPEEVWA